MTNIPLEVQVRHLAPATLAYIRHIGPYKGDTALFRQLFGQLFAWAGPRGLMGQMPATSACLKTIPTPHPRRSSGWKWPLWSPQARPRAGEIGIKTMDGGFYATARVRVTIQDYAAQWDALVGGLAAGKWLPAGSPSGHGVLPEQPRYRSRRPVPRGDLPTSAAAIALLCSHRKV